MGHTGSVESIVIPEALSLAVSGSLDGNAIIWDMQTLGVRSTCGHPGGVNKLAWLKDTPCFIRRGRTAGRASV